MCIGRCAERRPNIRLTERTFSAEGSLKIRLPLDRLGICIFLVLRFEALALWKQEERYQKKVSPSPLVCCAWVFLARRFPVRILGSFCGRSQAVASPYCTATYISIFESALLVRECGMKQWHHLPRLVCPLLPYLGALLSVWLPHPILPDIYSLIGC